MRIAAAVFAFAAGCAIAAEPAPNKALAALFDREFKRGLEEHPEQATFLGMPGYDDRLTDLSPAAVARRKAHVKEVRVSTRLKESAVCLVDDENQLSPHLERLLNPGQPVATRRRILEVNPNHPVLAGLQKRIEARADDPRVQDYIDQFVTRIHGANK